MRIVWLDDNEEFLTLVRTLAAPWRSQGHELVTTTDPLRALSIDAADLLIVDLAMPTHDGLTVLEAASRRTTPTIVVSSFISGQMGTLATAEGAHAVWDKSDLLRAWPADPAELLDT